MNDTLFDLSQLHELSYGNQEFVERMVHMFLDLTPDLLLRIEQALKEHNYPEIKAAAHKMKPSIDMMGIVSLSQKIRMLEQSAAEPSDTAQIPSLVEEITQTLNLVFTQLRSR